MSALVNTETGELIDLDAAAAERRAERIRLRLDAIADNYDAVMPMIRDAIAARDDLALGYRSVGDYVSDRFGGAMQRLGVEVRRAVVHELTTAGMSTRAIAPIVGVSKDTVQRDQIAGVSRETPVPNPSAQPPAEARPQGERATAAPRPSSPVAGPATTAPRPAVATVTGIDGKAYPRPAPAPAPKAPERSGEQQNAEENSQHLARALVFLLAFQHPNQRDTARAEWETGKHAVAPTPRDLVTPDHMRKAAEGLALLADEWENR